MHAILTDIHAIGIDIYAIAVWTVILAYIFLTMATVMATYGLPVTMVVLMVVVAIIQFIHSKRIPKNVARETGEDETYVKIVAETMFDLSHPIRSNRQINKERLEKKRLRRNGGLNLKIR